MRAVFKRIDIRLKTVIMIAYAMNGRVRARLCHREPRQLQSGAKHVWNMACERFYPIGRVKRLAPLSA